MLTWIILIVLVLLILAAIPAWPYSAGWGYSPVGILALILIIFLVLWLLGIFEVESEAAHIIRSV